MNTSYGYTNITGHYILLFSTSAVCFYLNKEESAVTRFQAIINNKWIIKEKQIAIMFFTVTWCYYF